MDVGRVKDGFCWVEVSVKALESVTVQFHTLTVPFVLELSCG